MDSGYVTFWLKWLAIGLIFFGGWGIAVLFLLWRIGTKIGG